MNSSISRRIQSAVNSFLKKDYEGSLINFFPALDRTAKKRRPKDKVGMRTKAFLREQGDVMTAVGMSVCMLDAKIEGVSFEEAIYKFGRNAIMHEGELDEKLKIIEGGKIRIRRVWELPSSMILGMIIGVITAPENKEEKVEIKGFLNIMGVKFEINELWGREIMIREFLSEKFGAKIKSPNFNP